MLLWVDDLRPAPSGQWAWVTTADAAIRLLRIGIVEIASLDHDLGPDSLPGTAITDFMAEHNIWPPAGVAIHSANPVGRATMQATIDRYGPY